MTLTRCRPSPADPPEPGRAGFSRSPQRPSKPRESPGRGAAPPQRPLPTRGPLARHARKGDSRLPPSPRTPLTTSLTQRDHRPLSQSPPNERRRPPPQRAAPPPEVLVSPVADTTRSSASKPEYPGRGAATTTAATPHPRYSCHPSLTQCDHRPLSPESPGRGAATTTAATPHPRSSCPCVAAL